ncbi:6550_t:CDS:1, partial [Dentiscutata heterogama]
LSFKDDQNLLALIRNQEKSHETAEQIQARHQAKEQKRIQELKQKYGAD